MPESEQFSDGDLEDAELVNLQPITLDDIKICSEQPLDDSELIDWKKRNHYVELCFGKRKRLPKLQSDHCLWNRALSKASSAGDEWETFDVEGIPAERATRYRYDAIHCRWVTDDVTVKMETESFNAGAMRRCFRAKKPSGLSSRDVWHRGNTNYVAKEYMETVPRETYFDDVKLQTEAKLWGNEYSGHNPPKKVDIVQMCCIELVDRPEKPLYHLEHYIEGEYVKYNSNSGFVRDENIRLTPQAFSHFTFERSGHELMVVDIQGVGDLYTDPQIHTADGESYGDGNLGTRGMALFFHSHVCNAICRSLGLTQFDLAKTEVGELSQFAQKQKLCKTVSRGLEEVCSSPREGGFDRQEFLRRRNTSSGCWSGGDDVSSPDEPESPLSLGNDSSDSSRNQEFLSKRSRLISECSTGSEAERIKFQDLAEVKQRPSNVQAEQERIGSSTALPSLLGQIHFELAKYHEVGRFLPPGRVGEYDRAAALFHLERAVDCGVLQAIITAADLYLGRPHDLLSDIQMDATPVNRARGVSLLTRASEAGDRASMVDVAHCYDLGTYLPEGEADRDWSRALNWYEKAVFCDSEEAPDQDPSYLLQGRAAEMLKTGGPSLEPDPARAAELFTEAAEAASAQMKGRLANKYFMEAEECWGLCPEEEE